MALSTWLQIINLKIETKRTAVQGTLSSSEMHAIHTEVTFSIYRRSPSEHLQKIGRLCVTISNVSIGLIKPIICKQVDALQKKKKKEKKEFFCFVLF